MHNLHLHRALIALMLCGTMTYTNISYANHTNAGTNHARAILAENSRIRKAITKLGNHDSDEALLAYHRDGHVLTFQVTDYDSRDKFKGNNLKRQIRYFQRHTGLSHVDVQVQLTKNALKKHHIQVREQAKQRVENHIEAVRAMKRARQQAKERAEKRAKAKKQAQQKARQKAKQQAQQKAKQKKQQQAKKAKQNAQKAKQKNQKKNQKNSASSQQ